MKFKVNIEYTDEFNQNFSSTILSENLDSEVVNEHSSTLEELLNHCKRAIIALGFSESMIEDENKK